MKPITIGTRVRWTSQAGGCTTTKEGVVVFNREKARHMPDLGGKANCPGQLGSEQFPDHRRMFDGYSWYGRDGVLVEVRDGKTARAKPKLYMPIPHKLEVIE